MSKVTRPAVRKALRFEGITKAAAHAGVSVQHLRLVLKRERTSHKLTAFVRQHYPDLMPRGKS